METTNHPRITKAHRICFILSQHPNLTRVEAMRRLHALEGRSRPFVPTSNHSYWVTTGGGNGGRCSVVFKGLVKVTGKVGNALTFANTEAGDKAVAEYLAFTKDAHEYADR